MTHIKMVTTEAINVSTNAKSTSIEKSEPLLVHKPNIDLKKCIK